MSRGSVALQIVILGLLFIALGRVTDGLWALAAGTASGWLRDRAGFARGERYVSGGVLVGLGVATALSSSARRT